MFPLGFLFVAFFKLFDCEFNTFYVSTIINNTYFTNSKEPPTCSSPFSVISKNLRASS